MSSVAANKALHEAIVEGFSLLGDGTKKALEEQLDLEGLDMAEEEPVDAKMLCAKLKDVFGAGSEPLIRIIYERFVDKLDAGQKMKFPAGTPVSECIIKTLEKNRHR
jgi:hypothetical protein